MTHAEIKLIKSLSQKKWREEHGLFAVEGEKLVKELLRSTFIPQKIIYSTPLPGAPASISEQVSRAVMERISSFKTPPSVMAAVEKPAPPPLPAMTPDELYLALDEVQDPGNLGTIIRLADWFGIRHIVCSPGTADCYNPKTLQASMGAIFRVHIHYTELPAFLSRAKDAAPVYGTFLDGANLYRQSLTKGGVIVMGNEGKGISAEVAATITSRLFIPPSPAGTPAPESLNVAVSTAIVCAEFRRQAHF